MRHTSRIAPAALIALLALIPPRAQAQQPADPTLPPAPLPIDAPVPPPEPPAPPAPDPISQASSPLLDPSNPLTQAGPGILGNPVVGKLPVLFDYRALWIPSQPVRGQPTSLGMERQDLSLSMPLWQCPTDELSFRAHVRWELLQTDAVLPLSRQPFPTDLWNIGLGGTYRHLFDNGWIAGGALQVGSASDRPFNSINEMNVAVSSFLRVPSGERNAWLFTLSYSPTAQLAFPIPGVAYQWVPNDRLRMNIGIPFSLTYRPIDDLRLDLSYVLLTNVNARATYRLSKQLSVYCAYTWSNEGYFLADRTDTNQRFLSYDMRAFVGTQYRVTQHFTVDLSGGYVFDRYYTETSKGSLSSQDRVDIGAGPFLSLNGRLRW